MMTGRRITKKRYIQLAISLLALVVGYLWQSTNLLDPIKQAATTEQPGLYTVARFVDGDTIAVDMQGTTETIRFIGVDTPETHKPNTPVQCYGPAAAAYTKNRIGSSKVRLVSDSLSTNRDRYNRLLRYVYLPDGSNVNQELVAKGYAFAYVSFPFSKSDDFSQAQDQAQQNKRGLWGNCKPYQQDNGRWQSNNAS